MRAVARSGNGVDVIEALAGTGKTFTAGTIRRVYEDAGYHVVGLGPSGRAVRELAEEAGIASWTIDRALIEVERHGDAFLPRTVVILDEAGMAATRGTERLLAHAQASGAKVIAIGDSGQLASVQAGGWMRAIGERIGSHELTEVMRQRDPAERRALGQLHAGTPENYLRWADQPRPAGGPHRRRRARRRARGLAGGGRRARSRRGGADRPRTAGSRGAERGGPRAAPRARRARPRSSPTARSSSRSATG